MNSNFFAGKETIKELMEQARRYMPDNSYDYSKLDKTDAILRMLYIIFLTLTAFAIDWYTLEQSKFANESWTKYLRG